MQNVFVGVQHLYVMSAAGGGHASTGTTTSSSSSTSCKASGAGAKPGAARSAFTGAGDGTHTLLWTGALRDTVSHVQHSTARGGGEVHGLPPHLAALQNALRLHSVGGNTVGPIRISACTTTRANTGSAGSTGSAAAGTAGPGAGGGRDARPSVLQIFGPSISSGGSSTSTSTSDDDYNGDGKGKDDVLRQAKVAGATAMGEGEPAGEVVAPAPAPAPGGGGGATVATIAAAIAGGEDRRPASPPSPPLLPAGSCATLTSTTGPRLAMEFLQVQQRQAASSSSSSNGSSSSSNWAGAAAPQRVFGGSRSSRSSRKSSFPFRDYCIFRSASSARGGASPVVWPTTHNAANAGADAGAAAQCVEGGGQPLKKPAGKHNNNNNNNINNSSDNNDSNNNNRGSPTSTLADLTDHMRGAGTARGGATAAAAAAAAGGQEVASPSTSGCLGSPADVGAGAGVGMGDNRQSWYLNPLCWGVHLGSSRLLLGGVRAKACASASVGPKPSACTARTNAKDAAAAAGAAAVSLSLATKGKGGKESVVCRVRVDCDAGTLSITVGDVDMGVVCSGLPIGQKRRRRSVEEESRPAGLVGERCLPPLLDLTKLEEGVGPVAAFASPSSTATATALRLATATNSTTCRVSILSYENLSLKQIRQQQSTRAAANKFLALAKVGQRAL